MSGSTGTCERGGGVRLRARDVKRLGLALAIWGLFGLALVAFRHDLAPLVFGPSPLDRVTLCAAAGADDLPARHVEVHGDRVERLFGSTYTPGREPYSYYALLHVGDRRLLILMPADHDGDTVRGLVEPFTQFETEYMMERLRARSPHGELVPFRLNMTRPQWAMILYFRVFPLAALLALAVWRSVRLRPHQSRVFSASSSGTSSATAARAGSASPTGW